ncbi:acetyl-/propionyl-CoA carboxylase subunit alpha [Nocardioides psychrotolerans]|uniref:biotin carboxylase n=1 Tax=Nocardioides psychrotolerans TaxID=1005945 RepID=A0A1I3BCA4_9ACTN|nr:biotin carboxylase N-terminal domain-containing protein [Nocardioides psychrotolerans]GEP36730.1 acetyl-/propionyl-CoA carboxylase subunit alpha [Nocardioides psychrotolerans]SFH59726.1 acetyl-CoA/propionyl-CoA carboxylase, biotin carboxylase, biotin carboxyl carrier protein [Nocardioides psychrotolerans]
MPQIKPLQKVLIANRGEIAVRVIRACKDAGIGSVAVYADPDRDALFVRIADEAHALGGATPAESYLDMAKIIAVAQKTGADSVHPGYGFLAENADFAQAVIDAGLIWIGPPPAAIEALGDKAKAKHIAQRANAPLAPGTKDPVKDADEIVAFAKENGLPVAIKAVFGGGGRGLKVARTLEEIPDAYESAVREAVTAFGRGECLVEKFLDQPRHVETQCLADQHGNVVVVSTRDCSLQRRHQKLVEEAPAPFLTEDQVTELYESSKAILREADYVGAGTCEFLVAKDGTISFLEVNTRLQVEHCVSEEVTGIDLVREMFRIAAGEELGYDDPEVRGHSIEFRINAEDGGRNFMPAPGTLSAWSPPQGPGIRLDGGYENGETVPGSFDSLIAKLIVTGRDRTQALERSRRALDEFVVDGMPTVIPFHRAVVIDPAYVGASTPSGEGEFTVYTTWIETDFDNQITPYGGTSAEADEPVETQKIVVEVGGKRLEVVIPAGLGGLSAGGGGAKKPKSAARKKAGAAASGDAVTSPMQGTIVKIAVEEGQEVAEGDVIVVLEAMKMEQPLKAHKAGTVTGLQAEVGATVTNGAVICELKD